MQDSPDLHQFTRGRFVQNEAHEMAIRCVEFNFDELCKAASEAVGANSCIKVEKFPDGMHNRVLLLTMDNGKEVVAKIPTAAAGQSHFVTASEAATMDFMRNNLNIPVPRLYSWCSHADQTPVGSEYIIMEKANGVPLKSVWSKLDLSKRFAVAKEISRLQEIWSSASYGGYGSLYYAQDLSGRTGLPVHLSGPEPSSLQKFAVGPITGRDWNDDGRDSVDFDRGPWKSLEGYLEAVGLRERACVEQLSQLPPPQITLCGPGTYQPSRTKKLRALNYYLQIYRHLVPSDPVICKPSMWHGDLHVENIFVDPIEPTRITSIIDWQSTEVAPLFVQARQPHLLDHEGPQVSGLERPQLPDNFASLAQQEKDMVNELLLNQSLCVGYRRWTQAKVAEVWKCFEFQEKPASELLMLARTLLVDGEALYAARIVEHLKMSDGILAKTGLSIPESIMAELEADGEGQARGIEAMSSVQEAMGDLFPERGFVRNGQYNEAKDALRQCKEQIIDLFAKTDADRAAWEQSWPFDD